MPGMAVATTSRTPDETSRLEIRCIPWSARYSSRASSGVMPPGPRPNRRSGPRLGQLADFAVAEGAGVAEGGGHPGFALELDHQDASPARAAIRASAAVIVVLPTPPLPATTSTRLWRQNAATSIPGRA